MTVIPIPFIYLVFGFAIGVTKLATASDKFDVPIKATPVISSAHDSDKPAVQ
jgi:hypothetical protein